MHSRQSAAAPAAGSADAADAAGPVAPAGSAGPADAAAPAAGRGRAGALLPGLPAARRSLAWTLLLGLGALPLAAATLILLPWAPLTARVLDPRLRAGAVWLGHDGPFRRPAPYADGGQVLNLLLQIAVGLVCAAMWAAVLLLGGTLVAMGLYALAHPGRGYGIGPWRDTGPAPIVLVDGVLTALLLVAVVLAARLLAWVSARATVLTNAADEGAAALVRSRDVLLDAFSGERRRIERELHDGPQQYLTAIRLNLAALELGLRHGRDPRDLAGTMESARANAAAALASLRAVVRGIAPQVLQDEGLVAALDELLAHCGLSARLTASGPDRALDHTRALLAYHCVSEALTNASRHGGATAVEVGLTWPQRLPGTMQIEIDDDGSGPGAPSGPGGTDGADGAGGAPGAGTGIAGLRERAAVLGGDLGLGASTRLGGARLVLDLPLPEEGPPPAPPSAPSPARARTPQEARP
ncbi:sensor histidine kinase [Actinomyces sp. oral taxon 414]|uniref:sensor histidine kinase n=1 Tax=Actinomyces sp. oral taxon 414 TaxID=712122 RepID=UPI0006B03B92|nr:histidine kinase [Actinomyces sp. oral taxon 414]